MTALQMGGLNSKVTLAPLFKGAGVAKRLEKPRRGKKVEQSSGVSLEEAADYFGGDMHMARTFLGLLHPEAGEDDAAVTVRPGGNPGANRWFLESNPTRIGWHQWKIDLRFAPGLPPGWGAGGTALLRGRGPDARLPLKSRKPPRPPGSPLPLIRHPCISVCTSVCTVF